MEELKNNPMSSVQDLSKEVDKIIDYSELRSHLKIQLEEIELLRAIYYRDNEFVISPVILSRVNHFIDEMCHHIPPLIEFTINLKFDDILTEFDVTLPRNYPTVEPIIIVRSNELNRFQQSSLNNDLKLYIESLDRSAVCVCESISWVSDNLSSYRQKDKNLSENVEQTEPENVVFSRYWIYSHHIYSKEKRKEIVSLARRYHITGFCLSGKPGIICIEGLNVNCEEWWQNIKNMTWKKIMCAKKEEIDVAFNSYESQRKFQDFCEISFPNLKSNSRESHTDMGEFFRYLLKHDCGHVFKDYFGFEGKVTNL